MGDTDECTRPRWDVADGIDSSDDGPGRRLILETDPPTGFPDEAVGDADGVQDDDSADDGTGGLGGV